MKVLFFSAESFRKRRSVCRPCRILQIIFRTGQIASLSLFQETEKRVKNTSEISGLAEKLSFISC
ncbi:hypothetical protein LEP1GSC058_1016 [Leptospira fainei serovar Hurstbridge str. BUT 6]|uniref:Uncharacterized protein n=1 Tax=Leptospira fainei serovar Hurstbridge str. BUT 6 TaxID=1193011 RepID=S3UTN3_9LEPT|nr:hypothetical protein LEP1GSC058_1016 [Leptospira fainei serovar Hurstbridge str. BUT 6]